MAARLGAASGPLICVFSVFWHRFFALAAPKTYENAYTLKLAHVLQRFARVSLGFLIFLIAIFYDLGAFWMLLERLH